MTAPRVEVRVAAVVVAYRPRAEELARTLAAAAPQVAVLVVVENGPDSAVPPGVAPPGATLLTVRLGWNLGLAAGQNAGIRRAREAGATHLLLLDQDSEPAPGMVARLQEAADRLGGQGIAVFAVGPAWTDPRTGVAGPLQRFAWPWEARVGESLGCDEVDGLIASGSLVTLAAAEAVGPLDETLFVYHVDTDWLLRARAMGLRSFMVRDAHMRHRIGEGLVRWWFFGPRVGILYPPRPWYYIFRNSLLLRRRPWAPLSWRLRELLRLPGLAFFAATRAAAPLACLEMAVRGLRDGLLGIAGAGPAGDAP